MGTMLLITLRASSLSEHEFVMKRGFWYGSTVCTVCASASPDICAWVVLIIGISDSKVVLQRQCNVILTLGMLASGRLDRGNFVARFVQ